MPAAPRIEWLRGSRQEGGAVVHAAQQESCLISILLHYDAYVGVAGGPADRAQNHRNRLSNTIGHADQSSRWPWLSRERQGIRRKRSARILDLVDESGDLNHRRRQDLGRRVCDIGRRIIAETTDAAERLHRLRERALTFVLRLQPILVQEAKVSLGYTEWRSYVMYEQIERLRGVSLGHKSVWHTSCLLSSILRCLHAHAS